MKTALKLPLGGGTGVQSPVRTVPRSPSQPRTRHVHLAPLVKPSSGLHLLPRLAASQGQAVQTDPMEDAMRWLASRVTAECKGFGASEEEVLRTLRSRGIECTYVKNRKRLFRVPGENVQVYASEVIRALQEETGQPSNNGRPAAYSAPASHSPPAAAPASPAPAASASGLEGLAAWISANYMGMGKSAQDALPELRRKGITASGNSFSMGGKLMSAPEIASALRLQARTPSRSSTPEPARPAPSAAPASYSAPAAAPAAPAAASASGLDGLAAWISANYMGMGKSAMDALPELRRKGITASGNSFSMSGQLMSAPEIASALRLQPRTPSRPSTPQPTRPAPSAAPASSSAPAAAPAAPAASASGLEGLAAYISANYMGMGKSAMDALPELRRKGITPSGKGFSMGGQLMDADGIAQALRLQARTPSRSSTPEPTCPAPSASYSAPAAAPAAPPPAASASGLEGLAAWISANYMGMGKSAQDALPELRRKGITASGNNFMMGGQVMSAPEIASALRLQARTPSRPSSPQPSRPAPSAAPASYSAPAAAPAAPAASASGLEGLAAYISTNYMGMGKSAADAMPELRRKGIAASGNSFSMGGQLMDADGIAQALRLQARTPSRPSTPTRPAPSAAPAAAPAAPTPAASASGLDGLAAWIADNYSGMGKSAMDVLPELRRKGITASGTSFSMGGQLMSAPEVASALRLQARTPSRPSTPEPTRPAPSASYSTPAAAPAAPAPAASASGLEGLAAWISANYMGMGKSAMDALPELRRKGITPSGNNFVMGGQVMSVPEIASALRLQARTPSRSSTPEPTRPAPAAAPASYSAPAAAPAAPAASASGLDGLAAWISANYMGMGKSAQDALPELRRKGITASGNSFSMGGQVMSASEIASALRLQARTPSRPSTPQPTRPAPSAAPASHSAPAAAPAAPTPAASASGLDGLAAWIADNYSGMGKSAMDVLPELRRKGITASGNSFSMGGQLMSAPEIASALRLQARTPSRPSTPPPSRPAPSAAPASHSAPAAAPAAPAASASGLEGLAAYISANYMGMGKSAMDALPELRRKGIIPSGKGFSMGGQLMDADGIAQALRLQARTPSRPSTPEPTRPAPSASYSAPAAAPAAPAPAASASGLEGLAAWISANYMGMGKSAMDALPELRRKGITPSGNNFVMNGQVKSAPEIATALRLEARPGSRPGSRPASPSRPAAPASPSPQPRAPSPPPPTTFGAKAGGPSELSPAEAIKAGTEWLAAWISANYVGMGKSALDALPELRRRGVVCTYVKDGHHLFRVPGEPTQVDAPQVAKMLQLRPR